MKLSQKTKDELGRLITIKEAAMVLNLTEARIRQYIIEERLPALKLGILIDPQDLDKIILKKRGRKPRGKKLEDPRYT